jgi:hypothetical protein
VLSTKQTAFAYVRGNIRRSGRDRLRHDALYLGTCMWQYELDGVIGCYMHMRFWLLTRASHSAGMLHGGKTAASCDGVTNFVPIKAA